jgi:hypothetical protein
MIRRPHLPLAAVLVVIATALTLFAASAQAARQRAGLGHAVAIEAQPRTQSPSNGATVSGEIKWRVSVHGARPRRVVLAVDGRVRTHRARRRTATQTLDTTLLSDGPHTLTAIAILPDGTRSGRSKVTVNVDNSPRPPANGPHSVYWGAEIGDQLTGTQAPWDMNAVTKFEGMAQKKLSMIHFAAPWANCSSSPCTYYPFDSSMMNRVRSHGAIPFFSWASQSIGQGGDPRSQPDFQLSDVAAGRHDAFIRSWATAAKNWGHPFFLRFNFEMNGNWFPWSEGVNGNQAGDYVAAWRHVHDIFTSVGATNATWVWCPNVDPGHRFQNIAALYPGDSYVDWTCLDGYNWGPAAGSSATSPTGWMTFDQLYKSTYNEIADTIAPSKPMVIGEIGATESGGSKAAWIQDALARAPSYPKMRGFLWFECFADGMDWPISTSASATDAFAAGIQNPAYTTNEFGNLDSSPIPPPS